MTYIEAIEMADELRPNAISTEVKLRFLGELEADFAEMTGTELPEGAPDGDAQLIIPAPRDTVYPLYLAAVIDDIVQDSALYTNDYAVAQAKIAECRAWWKRNNAPAIKANWRVM